MSNGSTNGKLLLRAFDRPVRYERPKNMIEVELLPVNPQASCREKGPKCRGRGPSNLMPAKANQRNGEMMLRIEMTLGRRSVYCVCSECAHGVLAKFGKIKMPKHDSFDEVEVPT